MSRLRVDTGALPGAEVWLDGNGLGGGPIQVELAPGDHQVEVRARKRVPLVLTLALDQAETTVRVAGERLRRPRWRLLSGVLAAAVGVTLTSLGAVAWAYNGKVVSDPQTGGCQETLIMDGLLPGCLRYNSLRIGVPLVALGTPLLLGGSGLVGWPGQERIIRVAAESSGQARPALALVF